MRIRTKTYRKFQELILKAEGKTLLDELGIGCKIDWYSKRYKQKQIATIFYGYGGFYKMTMYDGFVQTEEKFEDIKDKIIGKDIGLERVLKVAGKYNCHTYLFKTSIVISDDPYLSGLDFLNEDLADWTLGAPAHEQSIKTLRKLIKLFS